MTSFFIPKGLTVREVDGSPSGIVSTLVVSNGSLTVDGGTGTLQVGGSLTVREADGTPSGAVNTIVFENGTVSITDQTATITGLEGPQGETGLTGPAGATGATGATGPNTVSTSTSTNITGVLYGDGTNVSAATAAQRLGSVTKAELDTAVSDGNVLYVGDVTSNATHTGDVTGDTALTIANDAVTYAKMQNVSAASLLIGRGSASGAGDAEEITLGSGLTMSGTTLSAAGGIGGSTGATDNRILRSDGTGGATLQNSPVTIDDSGNVTGVAISGFTHVQFAGSRMNFQRSTGATVVNLTQSGEFALLSGGMIQWSNNAINPFAGGSVLDLSVSRNAAGIAQIGNGTANALGSLALTNLTASGTVTLGTYTVGTLPSAAANTRARAFASDSNLAFNSTNLGATVTAGGSTLVPVFSDGTNWVIG
jgi:hypothetical protein